MGTNSKKAMYNLTIGLFSEFLTIILGLIVPRLILTNYGSEINGLLSSVTQIYVYIGLLEGGIGAITLQALYRTIGKRDREGTNEVLAATNRYYHKTGTIYFIAIIIFSLIYPVVIRSDIPTHTVVLVIFFNGIGSVINFLFQGKYTILLQAEGKNYIRTSLTMFTNIFKNVAKIFLMAYGFDVVFVQAIAMVVSLIQMIYVVLYVKKNYKWIDLSVKPNYQAIAQSKNVMVHQIGGLVFNNTDVIILSVFCGLEVVSVYSLYVLILGTVKTLLSSLADGVSFIFGQTFHKDRERFEKISECYECFYMTITFSLFCIAYIFILPFLKLYTSGINDINYIDIKLSTLFIATYILPCARTTSTRIIEFAGHFKETQWRSILETIINLAVSLLCVYRFGIYGVLFGTIVALLYRTNDAIIYAHRKIMKTKVWPTYRRWIRNFILLVICSVLGRLLPQEYSGYIQLIIYACISATIVLTIFFGTNILIERDAAKTMLELLRPMLQGFKRKNC